MVANYREKEDNIRTQVSPLIKTSGVEKKEQSAKYAKKNTTAISTVNNQLLSKITRENHISEPPVVTSLICDHAL